MVFENLFGKKFYEVKTKCGNCRLLQLTRIKKGHIAKEVIGNGKCQNCGCQDLTIVEDKA